MLKPRRQGEGKGNRKESYGLPGVCLNSEDESEVVRGCDCEGSASPPTSNVPGLKLLFLPCDQNENMGANCSLDFF